MVFPTYLKEEKLFVICLVNLLTRLLMIRKFKNLIKNGNRWTYSQLYDFYKVQTKNEGHL